MGNQKYDAFLKVAETGSFKQAAHDLGYTQAGISYLVSTLERELDVPLFIRGVAGLQLTRYGEALRQSAFPYLQMHDNIIADLQAMKNESPQTLSLGYPTGLLINFPDDFLTRFITAHPEVDFQIYSAPDDSYNRSLQSSEIDIYFCTMLYNAPMVQVQYHYRHPVFAVLSQDHLLAAKPVLSLADFRGQKLIGLNTENALNVRMEQICQKQGLKATMVFSPAEMGLIFKLIESTRCVSFFGSDSIPLPPSIVKRPIGDLDLDYEFLIITHKNAPVTPIMEEFIRYTRSFF